MQFIVHFQEGRSPTTKRFPHVVLLQDNWDDYGYKTTFNATLHVSVDEQVDFGYLKILHKDQTSNYTPVPRQPFDALGNDFCSLGGNLDYYETLFKRGRAFYRSYLRALGDVAFDDEVRARFEDLEGYDVSLLRFSGAERTIADAGKLFVRQTPVSKKRRRGLVVKFKTQVAPNSNPFQIDFDFRRKGGLPNRINVLIGYNGTGKTRLLSNLAVVASGFGYTKKEDLLDKRAGRFVGTPPPFKTVVVVSYSAFDTFVIPGRSEIEKARLRDEGAIFGYVYCGLRELSENSVVIGRRQHEMVHHTKPDGRHYPSEECPIHASFKDGEVHRVSNEVFWPKDRSSFPVEYVSTPIQEEGTLVGAVVAFRDITKRRQAEDALKESEARGMSRASRGASRASKRKSEG